MGNLSKKERGFWREPDRLEEQRGLEEMEGLDKSEEQVELVKGSSNGKVRDGKIVACGQDTVTNFPGFAEKLKSSTTGMAGL